eukprot:444374_1
MSTKAKHFEIDQEESEIVVGQSDIFLVYSATSGSTTLTSLYSQSTSSESDVCTPSTCGNSISSSKLEIMYWTCSGSRLDLDCPQDNINEYNSWRNQPENQHLQIVSMWSNLAVYSGSQTYHRDLYVSYYINSSG